MNRSNYGGAPGPGPSYTQSFKEVLASTQLQIKLPGGVMLAQGQGVVEKGQVLAVLTATSLAVKYNPAGNDGSQIPVCILDNDQDTSDGQMPASGWIAGVFYADKCIGVDDTVKSTLKLCYFL